MIDIDLQTIPNQGLLIRGVRGDTRKIEVEVLDGDTPVDFTSWSEFYLTADSKLAPTTASTNVCQLDGVVDDDPLSGKVSFVPDPSVEAGNYFFDIQATDDLGQITTLGFGRYNLIQDITKI